MLAALVVSVIATSFDERGERQIQAASKIGWSINSRASAKTGAKSRLSGVDSVAWAGSSRLGVFSAGAEDRS
jgi:hypothetical protein